MSVLPSHEPACDEPEQRTVALNISARQRKLSETFSVRRLLPTAARRMVGPFIFFDHMGPATFDINEGLDVLPHPHINLATVTYLFDGEILHRDSLGTEQVITPGDVNWMTAGSGIVHSERSPMAARKTAAHVHGLQLWVALPTQHEEMQPSFQHHASRDIPTTQLGQARLRVVAGTAYGLTSPVHVMSDLFYVEATLPKGTALEVPAAYGERAAYVLEGGISAGGNVSGPATMAVFNDGVTVSIKAIEASRVMIFGGAPLGKRHIWWNFVSSSPKRIEAAKLAWKERRFAHVAGEGDAFVPLPSS